MSSPIGKTLVLVCVLFITACIGSAKTPLDTLSYTSNIQRSDNLIVFLRGMGGTLNCPTNAHKCFEVEGFVDAVRSRNLPFDMVAPNAHRGYYRGRSLIQRLKTDVILPAQADGYKKIWFVGISMGGLGALLYLKEHPEDVTGVIALGPYVGDDKILDEIQAAGGVQQWQPGTYDPNKQWQRMLWDWIKHYPSDSPDSPPIYLGLATDDLYLKGHRLLADSLPAERVVETTGKHRFKTFKVLWDDMLDQQFIR